MTFAKQSPVASPRRNAVRAAIVASSLLLLASPASADVLLLSATATSSGTMTLFGEPVNFASPSGLENAYGTIVTGSAIVSGTGGGALLHSWATVSHALGTTKNVSMQWRARTLNESFPWEPGGHPTQPPIDLANLDFGLASDIVEMTGFAPGEVFVMQMSYVDTLFDEATEAALGCIHINWLDPNIDGGTWVNAARGNSANDPTAVLNFQGSWAQAGFTTKLGSWGVDTTNNVVWAVLDHNSQFAVVPEPSSLALLGAAAAGTGLAAVRRRQRRSCR